MEMQFDTRVTASASEAWAVLGEQFGEVATWTNSIRSSSLEGELGVGAVRHCSIDGFGPVKAGVIKERLVEFDRDAMTFTYEAFAGLPGFMKVARNRWTISPDGDGCLIRSRATVELSGIMKLFTPLIKLKIKADAGRFMEEMRYRIENGQPHPRAEAVGAS